MANAWYDKDEIVKVALINSNYVPDPVNDTIGWVGEFIVGQPQIFSPSVIFSSVPTDVNISYILIYTDSNLIGLIDNAIGLPLVTSNSDLQVNFKGNLSKELPIARVSFVRPNYTPKVSPSFDKQKSKQLAYVPAVTASSVGLKKDSSPVSIKLGKSIQEGSIETPAKPIKVCSTKPPTKKITENPFRRIDII